MSDLSLALELMGVGMITVFVILALVVVIGNLIIRFVNKYIPEEIAKVVPVAANQKVGMNPKAIAAIVSAVNIITSGKGKVSKIEKI